MPKLWQCDPIVEGRRPWSDESWTVVAESAEQAARLLTSSEEFKGRWEGDHEMDPVSKVLVAPMMRMVTGTVSCIVPERKYQAAEWESLWDYDNSVEVTL